MHPSLPLQLLVEDLIHHPVPCCLHLALEGVADYHEAEVGLFGRGGGHGRVVSVCGGVIVDLKVMQGRKGGRELEESQIIVSDDREGEHEPSEAG